MYYMKRDSLQKFCILSMCVIAYLSPSSVFGATQVDVEAAVRAEFKDMPVMIEIARCESNFRQFTDSGAPLRGPGGMVGVFQFFEAIHTVPAKMLGFDITTLKGNLAYARHVYEMQGTVPWNSARSCWDVPVKASTSSSLSSSERAKLLQQITLLTKLIALLEAQLQQSAR